MESKFNLSCFNWKTSGQCIDKKWLQFVIDNCGCSNVKWLHLNNITFDEKTLIPTSQDTSRLFNTFVNKFDNLTNLKISSDGYDGSSHLGLIQLIGCCNALNNSKNKTRVRLHIDCNYANGKPLIDMIQETKITIDELEIVTLRKTLNLWNLFH